MKIITLILDAQKASDLAKKDYYDRKYYYNKKEACIMQAINLINKKRHCNVSYKIEKGVDQNGYPCNIFYFEFQMKGELYQFSFHNPRGQMRPKGKNSIKWNRIVGKCQQNYKEIRGKKPLNEI